MSNKKMSEEDARDVFEKVFDNTLYGIGGAIAGGVVGRKLASAKTRQAERRIFQREQEAMRGGPALTDSELRKLRSRSRQVVAREGAGMLAGAAGGTYYGFKGDGKPSDKRRK